MADLQMIGVLERFRRVQYGRKHLKRMRKKMAVSSDAMKTVSHHVDFFTNYKETHRKNNMEFYSVMEL